MYADDIDFQAVVKRSDVMDLAPAVSVATVTDEMNAHGRQNVEREGLVVRVQRHPSQNFQTTKPCRRCQPQTASIFSNPS
jgi:hypothetical protein